MHHTVGVVASFDSRFLLKLKYFWRDSAGCLTRIHTDGGGLQTLTPTCIQICFKLHSGG